MQITVSPPGLTQDAVTLTLRMHMPPVICSIDGERAAQWFDDPAANSAMNPDVSPIGAPEVCTTCLNELLAIGVVEITEVDPDSF